MNRFWNVAATGAVLTSLAAIAGASLGLTNGTLDGTLFAAVVTPIGTAWIAAMASLMPRGGE